MHHAGIDHKPGETMATRSISIRVSDSAARAYERASDETKRKLDALLSLRLTEAVRSGRIERGQNLLLEAFGGGFTWASALIRY